MVPDYYQINELKDKLNAKIWLEEVMVQHYLNSELLKIAKSTTPLGRLVVNYNGRGLKNKISDVPSL